MRASNTGRVPSAVPPSTEGVARSSEAVAGSGQPRGINHGPVLLLPKHRVLYDFHAFDPAGRQLSVARGEIVRVVPDPLYTHEHGNLPVEEGWVHVHRYNPDGSVSMGYVPEAYLLYLPKDPQRSNWWFSYTIQMDNTGEVMPDVDESLLSPMVVASGGGSVAGSKGSKGEVVSIPSAAPDPDAADADATAAGAAAGAGPPVSEADRDLGQGQDPLGLSLAEALFKRGDRVHYRLENNQLVPATIVDVLVLKAKDGESDGLDLDGYSAQELERMEAREYQLMLDQGFRFSGHDAVVGGRTPRPVASHELKYPGFNHDAHMVGG